MRNGRASALVAALLVWSSLCMGAEVGIPGDSLAGADWSIPGSLFKPDGPGPFPAVVIAHDCSGLGPTSSGAPGRWARELVAHGYVVLLPDSFTPRGHPEGVCTVPLSQRRADVSPARRTNDAYAALAFLRALPFVDGRRVGLMGGSHGGSTTLATMADARGGFVAAVSLYPACSPLLRNAYVPAAPVLILIGDKDDWTPADYCGRLVEASRNAAHPLAIKVYPGAHHSFDSNRPVRYVAARVNPNVRGGRGATTGGDPAAWADSIREVLGFFGQHLAR